MEGLRLTPSIYLFDALFYFSVRDMAELRSGIPMKGE